MQHKRSYGGGKYRRRGCETLPPDSEDQKQKSTVCMPTPDTLPWEPSQLFMQWMCTCVSDQVFADLASRGHLVGCLTATEGNDVALTTLWQISHLHRLRQDGEKISQELLLIRILSTAVECSITVIKVFLQIWFYKTVFQTASLALLPKCPSHL